MLALQIFYLRQIMDTVLYEQFSLEHFDFLPQI